MIVQMSPAPAATGAEVRVLQVRLSASQSETVCVVVVVVVLHIRCIGFMYVCIRSLLRLCTLVCRGLYVCARVFELVLLLRL